MRFRIFIVGSFLFAKLFTVSAQNLVPNPGFDELSRCPQSLSTDKKDFIVPGWESPTIGTPDHFHGCSWGEADVPFNWAGSSNARSGKGYAGIYVWSTEPERNYREYLQCELAEPLKKGEKYILEVFYKLAPYSVYAVNRFGMTLTDTRINLQDDKVINLTPLISVENDTAILRTTGGWEQAKLEYVANGGERFVVIGNFFDNKSTKATRFPFRFGKSERLSTSAYYYVDDVSVKPIDSLKQKVVPIVPKFKRDTIELNTDYILKNITFEFDSYVLLRQSFVELDKVVEYLKLRPDVSVRLSGHTDFIGSDEYNLTLSRNRARSVADHFISRGILSQRIISYGFGKSRPIMLSKTDEDRQINRRVEIRFVIEPVQ
jgi:outer membrane protein OmpA-like peptidoglycan-associated protein